MDFAVDFVLGALKIIGALILLVAMLAVAVRVIRGSAKRRWVPYRLIDHLIGKNLVLELELKGPILDDPTAVSPAARRYATFGQEFYDALIAAARNKNIIGVIIKCTTPGGTATASDLISQGVAICKSVKPVYVHVSSMCASGGVWGLCGASRINASPTASIGSIGVLGPSLVRYKGVTEIGNGIFGGHVNATEITVDMLHKGRGKTFGSPFVDVDVDVREHYERLLTKTYDRFVDKVAHDRGMAKDIVVEMGALLYDAETAVRKGLIDRLASLEDTKRTLVQDLGLEVADCNFLPTKMALGFPANLFSAGPLASPTSPAHVMQEIGVELRQHLFLAMTPLFFNDR